MDRSLENQLHTGEFKQDKLLFVLGYPIRKLKCVIVGDRVRVGLGEGLGLVAHCVYSAKALCTDLGRKRALGS